MAITRIGTITLAVMDAAGVTTVAATTPDLLAAIATAAGITAPQPQAGYTVLDALHRDHRFQQSQVVRDLGSRHVHVRSFRRADAPEEPPPPRLRRSQQAAGGTPQREPLYRLPDDLWASNRFVGAVLPCAPELVTEAQRTVTGQHLAAALRQLTARQRSRVVAYYGLAGALPQPATAVAAVEGVTETAIRSALAEAIGVLRRALQPALAPYEPATAAPEAGIHPLLHAKIAKTPEGCWLWTGGVDHGVPYWKLDGTKRSVRADLYAHAYGPLAPGHRASPTCGDPRCVCPDHLEARAPSPPRPSGTQRR